MGNMLYSPWNSIGTKVDGVTFNGAGYKVDPDGTNISISNNTFENNSSGSAYYGNGMYIPDVETGTSITGNTFTNITGNMGIYIFNAINTQITNNTFTNDGQAIKGQWFNGGANCSFSNNTLSEIYRFGIECQGDPTNLTVSGNPSATGSSATAISACPSPPAKATASTSPTTPSSARDSATPTPTTPRSKRWETTSPSPTITRSAGAGENWSVYQPLGHQKQHLGRHRRRLGPRGRRHQPEP